MNMDNMNLEALGQDLRNFSQPPQRGWWSRNWLWFVPTLLLTLIILCCGCPLGMFVWIFSKVYDLEVFQTAMQKIEADDGLRRELGEPIEPVHWPPPAFRVETTNGRGEADIRWSIEGPKGQAKAHVQARIDNDRWQLIILEVELSNGKKVILSGDAGVDDAPLFNGPKTDAEEPSVNAPPPEIDLAVPAGDPPGK